MRTIIAAAVAFVLSGCAGLRCPERGGPAWWLVRSEHFDIRTDLPPEQARTRATELEGIRAAVLGAAWRNATPKTPKVDVVLVREGVELELMAPKNVAGYVAVGGQGERFLVAQGNDREHLAPGPRGWSGVLVSVLGVTRWRTVVTHEITHVVDDALLMRQPRWLNEGLATFFETIEVDPGGRATIGVLPFSPNDVEELRRHIEADAVLRGRSTKFTQGIWFYGQSWALVHFLLFDKGDQFSDYQRRLMRAENPDAAWRAVFPGLEGKALDDAVAAHLAEFERQHAYPTFKRDVPSWNGPVEITELPHAEVHALWARIGRSAPRGSWITAHRSEEAAEAYRIDATNVAAAEERVLGLPVESGVRVMRAAVQAHPDDWRAHLVLAWLLAEQPDSAAERASAVERAAELAPDEASAHRELAVLRLAQGRTQDALLSAQRAAALAQGQPLILDVLAKALAASGKCEDALTIERQAVELHGEFEHRARAAAKLQDNLAALEKQCGGATPP